MSMSILGKALCSHSHFVVRSSHRASDWLEQIILQLIVVKGNLSILQTPHATSRTWIMNVIYTKLSTLC